MKNTGMISQIAQLILLTFVIRFIRLNKISFAHSFTGEKYAGMVMGFKEKIKAPGKSRKVK